MKTSIQVLIVDDSAIVRQSLIEVISNISGVEVMDTANDPIIAATKMRAAIPDVIILDVEMPRMDGLTFLQKIMTQHPIPIIICSSLAEEGSDTALKALEYGAIEVIFKPRLGTQKFLEEAEIVIGDAIKAAASARLKVRQPGAADTNKVAPKLTADAVLPAAKSNAMLQTTEKVIVVGASTGGTVALKIFLEAMPENAPGIVIVQHMPENFTRSFANRLNETCRISVKEAENNDSVTPGSALIAPGNAHCLLKRSGARYYTEVKNGPLVSRHRPAVDVLFRSAANYGGSNVIGVIMTGMGDDGAKGMLEMKNSGALNLAQDEESCVVYGMPKEAVKLGCVDHILPLEQLSSKVLQLARS